MEQYIPKFAIVAEIKKRKAICEKVILDLRTQDNKAYYHGKAQAYGEALDYLDTFKAKDVDLDKEIEKCLKQYHMLAVGKKDFASIAKHFFELGLKAQKGE